MESPPASVFHHKYQSYKYDKNTAGKSASEYDDSGKSGDSGESGESGISHVNRAKAEICSVEEKMIKKLFQCLLKRSENIKKTS